MPSLEAPPTACSFYSVVYYVPDEIADERINIGVIAFRDGAIRSKFLTDWQRVRCFSPNVNMTIIEELSNDFLNAGNQPEFLMKERIDSDYIRRISNKWNHSFRVTEPRASLQQPDILVNDMANLFLIEPRRNTLLAAPIVATVSGPTRPIMSRSAVLLFAKREVKRAIKARVGKEIFKTLYHEKYKIIGQKDDHIFDIGIASESQTLCAMQALTFSSLDSREGQLNIDASAWIIEDAKIRNPGLNIGIAAQISEPNSPQLRKAESIFGSLGAPILTGDNIGRWAAEHAA